MCQEEIIVKNAPVWKVTLRLCRGAHPSMRWHLKVSHTFFKSEFVKCVFPSISFFFFFWTTGTAAPSSCRPGVQGCESKKGLTSTKLSTYKWAQHKSCFYSLSFKKKQTERQYTHWKPQKKQNCSLKYWPYYDLLLPLERSFTKLFIFDFFSSCSITKLK